MKKLRITGIIIMFISIASFGLHFAIPYPDWLIRVNGLLMLIAIFTVVFTTTRTLMNKRKSDI